MAIYDSANVQRLLDSLRDGHDSARQCLLEYSLGRFQRLARRMLRQHKDLRALDATDDVLQKALVRLYRALAQIKPPNTRAFLGLEARQVRWVLLDLVREAASGTPIVY